MIRGGTERLLPTPRSRRERWAAALHLALAGRFSPAARDRSFWQRVLHDDALPLGNRAACCFAHHDPEAVVDPTVFAYLEALVRNGFIVVFISTAPDIPAAALERLKPLCSRIILRENIGLDFASWKSALQTFPDLVHAEALLLANDSAWLTGRLAPVLNAMKEAPCDFWGLVASRERRLHVQSNFLYFRKTALAHSAFSAFWRQVRTLESKPLVIRRYETTLTLRLQLAGLRAAAFVPPWWLGDAGKRNPSLDKGVTLLPLLGVPFIKRQLLRENPLGTDISDWESSVELPGAVSKLRNHASRLGFELPVREERAPVAARPCVDVLLPVYNGARFLPLLLSSVARQQGCDVRLIARDDDSSDQSMDLLRGYADRHAGTRVETGPRLGVMENVAALLHRSDGPYFALADQDDFWFPHKIALLHDAMERMERAYGKNTPLLAFSDARLIDEHGRQLAPSFRKAAGLPHTWGSTVAQALVMSPAPGCTMLGNAALRHTALPFPGDIFMHDWWLFLIAKTLGHTAYFSFPLVDYRQHGHNTLGTPGPGLGQRLAHRLRTGSTLRLTRCQAGALLTRFADAMTPKTRAVCEAWASLGQEPYGRRLRICVRHGFYKPGLLRCLAFLGEL